ncbi:MAG: hypothetical protein IJ618_00035 [Prevotella sp.]|nr:hypothetical protein [Prevotella sp.]
MFAKIRYFFEYTKNCLPKFHLTHGKGQTYEVNLNFPKSSSTDDVEKVGGWTTIGNRNATYTIEPAYQTTGTSDNAALVITGTDSNGNSRKTDLTMLMIPQKLSDDAKIVYDINNNVIVNPVSKVAATGKIGDAIANPMTFYTSNGDWLGNVVGEIEEPDKHFWNLWSANSNVTTANDFAVVKTVYDPCPAGSCLPPSNAFTGFTDDGLDHGAWNLFDDRAKETDGTTLLPANNVTYNNISYNIDNSHFNIDSSISPSTNGYDGGWQFYCGTAENGIWKKGESLFMVTICERTCAGNLNVGTYGHYWTAVAGPYPEYYDNQEAYDLTVNNQKVTGRTRSQSKAYNARFLFFTPNYVDPVDNQRGTGRAHNKGFGWNVWPVKEKEGW